MSSILIYGGVYVSRFRVLAVTLIFSLCLSFSSWAVTDSILYDSDGFAKQVNTYKDLALSASNAIRNKSWDDNVSVASSVATVNNTVDFSGCFVEIRYKDSSGGYSYVHQVPLSIGGTFSYIVPSGEKANELIFWLHPTASLPSVGKYKMTFDFASDTDLSYDGCGIWSSWTAKNQEGKSYGSPFPNTRVNSGDISASLILSIQSNVKNFALNLYLKDAVSSGGAIGGKMSINFSQSTSTPDYTTPGTAPSDTDIQSGIASTTSQIASSVNDVYDSIHDLMQHISNQLAALWDQMYNYMHVPTYNKLQEILQAIQAIQLKVNVDVSSVVDAVDNSADRISDSVNSSINNQITNDNKNADDIKNGYDNSGMKADNDRLNDKISQYDNVEDQLFDDAKNKIGNFTFENPLTKYTDVLSDISYFLSGIYTALGALNIPVGFSLTLTIALIFIGYYRFKGGS